MISLFPKVLQFGSYGMRTFAGKFANPVHTMEGNRVNSFFYKFKLRDHKISHECFWVTGRSISRDPRKDQLSRILLVCISSSVSLILLFSKVRVSTCLVSVATVVCNNLFSVWSCSIWSYAKFKLDLMSFICECTDSSRSNFLLMDCKTLNSTSVGNKSSVSVAESFFFRLARLENSRLHWEKW